MNTNVIPSAVVATIAWVLDTPSLTSLIGDGASSKLPKEGLTFPWLTVQRITGIAQHPEIPIDYARLQFNAWGGLKANGLPDWAPADELIRTLENEIRNFRGWSDATAHISQMAPYEGIQQLEDPVTGDARFWMDAMVAVRRADGT